LQYTTQRSTQMKLCHTHIDIMVGSRSGTQQHSNLRAPLASHVQQ